MGWVAEDTHKLIGVGNLVHLHMPPISAIPAMGVWSYRVISVHGHLNGGGHNLRENFRGMPA